MTENIVSLRDPKFTKPGEPNAAVVSRLEKYLEQARRGEIDAISIAISRPNGRLLTDFYTGPDPMRLVAATSLLNHDICKTMGESGD